MPVEFFVGRQDAIKRLRGLVRAADRGVFKIGFISGERGIGKSSLASFVRHVTPPQFGPGCSKEMLFTRAYTRVPARSLRSAAASRVTRARSRPPPMSTSASA